MRSTWYSNIYFGDVIMEEDFNRSDTRTKFLDNKWADVCIMPLLFTLCFYAVFLLISAFLWKPVYGRLQAVAVESLDQWETRIVNTEQADAFAETFAVLRAAILEKQEQERLLAEYAAKSPQLSKSTITLPKEGDKYATISIERLGMSVSLYYGDTNALLKKGAGQYIGNGSAIFGEGRQILVAGHNTREFKPLQNAEIGDIVKVTTTYGEYAYQIVRIEVHNMNDTSSYDFNLDHEQLAMYTCYPFSGPPGKTERYFCYCDKLYGPVLVD